MIGKDRAKERIENIKAQIEAYEAGEQTSITCPYCAGVNTPLSEFCCDLFGEASVAALGRIRTEQSIRVAKQAMERHGNN